MENARTERVKSASVSLRYRSILDFHTNQSFNINRWGMFLPFSEPFPAGTLVDLSLSLDDGLPLLQGKGEVVWVVSIPVRGMGIRFLDLDVGSRKCLEGIVTTNERERRRSSVPLNFSSASAPTPGKAMEWDSQDSPLRGATRVGPGLFVSGRDLHIHLSPATAGYFINNPLINIRLGGFVIPCDEAVSLGFEFEVVIESPAGDRLYAGKGKVVAKHENRLGIRFIDPERVQMVKLQTAIGGMTPISK
jgi:hypothetical protein